MVEEHFKNDNISEQFHLFSGLNYGWGNLRLREDKHKIYWSDLAVM